MLVASVAALFSLSAPESQSAPLRAQGRQVMLGLIDPDPTAFDRLTRHRHSLRLVFNYVSQEWLEKEAAAGRTAVVTVSPRGYSSAAIAKGSADAKLVEQAKQANNFGQDVWIRPMPEMNGHWSPWCAVTASGKSRGAAYSGKAFARAFKRIAIIMRGGSADEVNLELRQAGLRPVKSSLLAAGGETEPGITASGNVKLLWNPQGEGSPNVGGNSPRAYWPGARFVDYLGDDLYEIRGRASWTTMDALYKAYRKPFVIAEWAPWGYDSPSFVKKMFSWVRSHPRTIGLIYFNKGWSRGGSTFSLKAKPRSLAAYRRAAASALFQTG
ncbi:MAG: glycoside hydrolase family 26 protein [Gaiellaceae bacterium]